MGDPTVSVVMPTHNRRDLLPEVLEPLLDDPAASELVVVVDGSRDGSYELLQQRAESDSRLKPIYIENRGKEGARQAGLEQATGDVVLFLDDDVKAAPRLVTGHAKAHEPGLLVLGYMPVKLPDERRPGDASTLLYAVEYEGRCRKYEEDPSTILSTLWGGNFSMPREDALRVGLVSNFNEGYHQDRDFGLRCMKAGLTARFDRRLKAEHLHQRSLDAFLRDARKQGAARAQIHELHTDVLGPLPDDEFVRDLPAPVKALVRAARRPGLLRALKAMASAAGRLRLWALETAAVKVLRRVEQQRGALGAA